jgi:predicted DNA-binding transcriptional regulator
MRAATDFFPNLHFVVYSHSLLCASFRRMTIAEPANSQVAREASPSRKGVKFTFLFLIVAILCSMPRFGQRENANLPGLSDSDVYLDLARVLTGEKTGFSSDSLLRPHHLSRPFLCFLAGWTSKLIPGVSLGAGFSIWNILFSTLLAWLLWRVLETWNSDSPLNGLPSVLYLTSFVQMNWGYHILTDTAGFATAMLVMYMVDQWLRRVENGEIHSLSQIVARLILLWFLSSIAFLTRETGIFSIFIVVIYAFKFLRKGLLSKHLVLLGWIGGSILAGKIPHLLYQKIYKTVGVPLALDFSHLFNAKFFFDAAAKSAVSFHFAWLIIFWTLIKHWRGIRFPTLLIAWLLACLIYIGGGYFVNSLIHFPYPLRMTFSLFPLAYVLVVYFFSTIKSDEKRFWSILVFLVAHIGVSLAGIYFDPGVEGLGLKETLLNLLN